MSAIQLSDFEHKFTNPSDVLHDALTGSFIEKKSACKIAMVNPITDDLDIVDTLYAAIDTFFE